MLDWKITERQPQMYICVTDWEVISGLERGNGEGDFRDSGKFEESPKCHKEGCAIANKKIEMGMINTLQLAARKNLIQMSSDVINYNYLALITIVTVSPDQQLAVIVLFFDT
jgi:hypothetical protein